MLHLSFTLTDLTRLRFAGSPLGELVASLRVLQAPAGRFPHATWVERTRPRLAGFDPDDLALIRALVPPTGYLPDFLTPPPVTALPALADELAVLRATPPDQVRADLAILASGVAHPPQLDNPPRHLGTEAADLPPPLASMRRRPRPALDHLADILAAYWEVAIAPHWVAMRALFDADVAYRAGRLATGGADRLFSDLHPALRWQHDGIVISKGPTARSMLDGRGLLLIPSVFAWPSLLMVTTDPVQPRITYPARGLAAMWQPPRRASGGLAAALGRTRADLLVALAAPGGTGELSARLGVTAAAVSQHLGVLRGAGFVTTVRSGRCAVHARTPLGDAVVSGRY